jgi:hypothetical protein
MSENTLADRFRQEHTTEWARLQEILLPHLIGLLSDIKKRHPAVDLEAVCFSLADGIWNLIFESEVMTDFELQAPNDMNSLPLFIIQEVAKMYNTDGDELDLHQLDTIFEIADWFLATANKAVNSARN